jgi:hypothetical protein
MGNKKEVVLPTHNDDEELANRFGDFFLGKIETIRDNLTLCVGNTTSFLFPMISLHIL